MNPENQRRRSLLIFLVGRKVKNQHLTKAGKISLIVCWMVNMGREIILKVQVHNTTNSRNMGIEVGNLADLE
jgi:hypothetical protein